MTRKEAEDQVRLIGRTCKGPYKDEESKIAVNVLLQASMNVAAERLAASSRAGCGADFNNVIVAGPFDGEEHEYKCPKCGVTGTYKAPDFGSLT